MLELRRQKWILKYAAVILNATYPTPLPERSKSIFTSETH